jgi:hypothetical protein
MIASEAQQIQGAAQAADLATTTRCYFCRYEESLKCYGLLADLPSWSFALHFPWLRVATGGGLRFAGAAELSN